MLTLFPCLKKKKLRWGRRLHNASYGRNSQFLKVISAHKRGGKMDAPLVLTTRIDPKEVDKEAHNIDVPARYPLEFYRATQEIKNPTEIESMMDLVSSRLGTPEQYEHFMFTHDTSNIAAGPLHSSYKTLEA
jgi:DNA polymerase II large subunit